MADDRADVDSAEIVHAFERDSSILDNPLAAKSYAKGADTTITGEEDEEVKAELKGAKVFIKRGDKDFSDGILGNIKLLSHRETTDERLLFRREPVWKVTMSVRLGSAVRCTFDEEQGVLRVMLKESEERVGVSPQRWEQKVVIYAVKRGKASKTDFAAFAHTVSARAQFAHPSSAEPSSA
ncbi:hypothetical protein WOLCODRAFT_165216 [Wolfiporia cocos MD-104 SS10]|uniref:RanBD1 domain-containing protein n=1 Tax=Wolfiporia cocos (strain MD-104) TaxID=742152 RepID=A0A2H3K632_WOLCO|nr:hypothetical protein WOLCODRAFT_165216 [Wolfiporia cocos MD-104 SS10]